MSTADFASLPLSPAMLKNLHTLGFEQMTPIQAQSLPSMLEGSDVIAKAKTGSGKTVAFGLGLLSRLEVQRYRVQSLVLCPTRELADQVAKELRRLARFTQNIKVLTLCGGMPFGPQIGSLEHGAHIVVGTPGRVQEHLRKGTLHLDDLNTLVLDEADRMLDMGFADAMRNVVSYIPGPHQTLLFSATYPDSISELSAEFQTDPVEVTVESIHSHSHIEQQFYEIERDQRNQVLAGLLAHHQPESAVVFCNTKKACQEVADYLSQLGFYAQALHGDLEQKIRDQVLVRFANKSCSILVATDVAARGLDIKDLQAVINYELSRDPEVHVHRIGRTGRAGQKGLALSLVTPKEAYKVNAIEEYQQAEVSWADAATLPELPELLPTPSMATLAIDGGRKNKVRPGDILGALTGQDGIAGADVGKIDIFEFHAYVAVRRSAVRKALAKLRNGKIKGRQFKVRQLR
ncbi:ATP-dependent RNA helicase DbpA [Marinobacterium arenosum]|uniref:ATP-dependent RNA helicase DbpA n=1 Tax=Marinobacterium arenosum TaxID=2862496 RepID=UPI001C9506F8|nr:ATP-dependent RNA helicase DbpA [Marinobacterium arenosum]MBY4676338.1 ATP-dependent RNA helicase DbpA [Marinobacterium arenosum]